MENVSMSKSRSQYLSLVVKKICQDRLNFKELEYYKFLKIEVDPFGIMEEELIKAWRRAEDQDMGGLINSTVNRSKSKILSLKNLLKMGKSC